MLISQFKIMRDPVEVWLEQFAAKFPRRSLWRPWNASLFISAKHQARTFLPHIDFRFEIDDVRQFMSVAFVKLNNFGHIIGDEILMRHGQHRKLKAYHATHFTRPQPATVDNMLGVNVAFFCDHIP